MEDSCKHTRFARLWILVLLAAMLAELSAGMSGTAAALFHTPDDIAAVLSEPAESSDDDPSDNPDDACLRRVLRMLPAAVLCPGGVMPPAADRTSKQVRTSRRSDRAGCHTGRTACRTFCIYRI